MSFLMNVYRYVSSAVNKSINFDGTNDNISITQINLGTTYTVSTWIKYDTVGRTIMGNTGLQYFFYNSGTLLSVNRGSDFKTWSWTASTGTWYHIATVRNNSTEEEVYINGVSQGSKTFSTNVDMLIDVIGWQGSGGQYFDGNITETLFYSDAKTAGEISTLYNSGCPESSPTTTNLLHRYKLGNDDTYPTATDSQGSNNGTMNNMDSGDFETVYPC